MLLSFFLFGQDSEWERKYGPVLSKFLKWRVPLNGRHFLSFLLFFLSSSPGIVSYSLCNAGREEEKEEKKEGTYARILILCPHNRPKDRKNHGCEITENKRIAGHMLLPHNELRMCVKRLRPSRIRIFLCVQHVRWQRESRYAPARIAVSRVTTGERSPYASNAAPVLPAACVRYFTAHTCMPWPLGKEKSPTIRRMIVLAISFSWSGTGGQVNQWLIAKRVNFIHQSLVEPPVFIYSFFSFYYCQAIISFPLFLCGLTDKKKER